MGLWKQLCEKADKAIEPYKQILRFNGKVYFVESPEEVGWDSTKSLTELLGRKAGLSKGGNVFLFKIDRMHELYLEKGEAAFLLILIGILKHELRHWHQDQVGSCLLGKELWKKFSKNLYYKYGYRDCPLEVDARTMEYGRPQMMTDVVQRWIRENPDCL